MELGIGQDIIETIILIELGLIVLLILGAYVTKMYLHYKNKSEMKLKKEIENHIVKSIEAKEKLDTKNFKRRWKEIDLVYPVYSELENRYANQGAWETVKADLIHDVMLPLARRESDSRQWQERFFAAETFSLKMDKPEDIKHIIKLAGDNVPLVYLHAISAAITYRSEKALNSIITRMSKSSWLTQTIYLEPFERATPEVSSLVVRRLEQDQNVDVRSVCYSILLKFPPQKITWNIENDLRSEDFQLRLRALKYITYVDKQKAVPILLEKLNDDHWEVKLVALHRLADIQPREALPQISKCLQDSDWWVKMAAAETLKSMGDDGQNILKKHAPDLDIIPFKATERAPHALW